METHSTDSEAQSVASSGNEGEQHTLLKGQGDVSLTSEGMFELKISDSPSMKERSVLEAEDLDPLFDMVAFKADDNASPCIDSAGLREILQSVDAGYGQTDVQEIYSALGVAANTNLSLEQLRRAWTMRRCQGGHGPGD